MKRDRKIEDFNQEECKKNRNYDSSHLFLIHKVIMYNLRMKIKAIRTHKITVRDKDLLKILDTYIKTFEDGSVLAVTSKIVSICEGSVKKINSLDKDDLITKEADYYLPRSASKYNVMLTIKNTLIIPSAGIDESNSQGYYVLWPKDAQRSANQIREYLCKRFKIRYAGVIITDSTTDPLRWGTRGVYIAHSGFAALNDFVGKPDIFGRKMEMTKVNVADGLAASTVLTMGESREQTPLALIEDVPFVKFQPRNPTIKELNFLKIPMNDDLYAPILKAVKWRKGRS